MGVSASIHPTHQGRDTLLLIKQMPLRLRKLRSEFLYRAVKFAFDELTNRIPATQELRAYRSSLEMARITGVGKDSDAYAIRANLKARLVRKVDVPRTILYIRARSKLRKVPPEIAILERFNPWTVETLPFVPNRKDAVMVQRKSNNKEVVSVAREKNRLSKEWKRELARVGIRGSKLAKARVKLAKPIKVIPDVFYDALRLEFGLGGMKPKPHWRPAILRMMTTGVPSIRSALFTKDNLTQFQRRAWVNFPTRVSKRITVSEAKSFAEFQRRLGIRVSI